MSGTVKLYHNKAPSLQKGKLVQIEEEGAAQQDDDDQSTVSPGNTFGELCLFEDLGKFRSETAVCTSEVHVVVLTRSSFEKLSGVHPLLASRIRKYCELLALQKSDKVPIQEGKHGMKVHESALDLALSSAFETVTMMKVSELNLEPSAHEFTFSAWRFRETSGCVPEDAYYSSIVEENGATHALVKDVFAVRQDGEVLVWEGTLEGMRASSPTSLGYLAGKIYEECAEAVHITQTGKPFVSTKKVFEFRLCLSRKRAEEVAIRKVHVLVDRMSHEETQQKLLRIKDSLQAMGVSDILHTMGVADVSISEQNFVGDDVEISGVAPKRTIDVSSDIHFQRRAKLEEQVHELRERMSGMDEKMDKIIGMLSSMAVSFGIA